jgi:hypothetical protein
LQGQPPALTCTDFAEEEQELRALFDELTASLDADDALQQLLGHVADAAHLPKNRQFDLV